MKCIVAIAIAMLVYSACNTQSISGKMSYPNHNQFGSSIDCMPLSYDGTAVYEVSLQVVNSAGTYLAPITINSSGFTVSTIAGTIKLFPAPVGNQMNQNNWLNHWKNGVTVDDVTILQRHINGIEPFRCPFRVLAGDVNKSGTLSTLDALTIQALIVNGTIPTGQPWRYIAKSLVLPDFNPDLVFYDKFWSITNTLNATTIINGKFLTYQGTIGQNTWMDYWESAISLNSTAPACTDKVGFFAIKMGDVNGNAQRDNLNSIPSFWSSDQNLAFIEKKGTELRSGLTLAGDERYEVKISALSEKESICAYQVGLKFDNQSLSFEKTKKSKERTLKQSDNDFTTNPELLEKGDFRSAWTIDYAVDKTGFEPDREVELFSFNVKAKKDIAKITDAVSLDKTTIDALFFNYDVKPIKDVKLFISIRQLQPGEE